MQPLISPRLRPETVSPSATTSKKAGAAVSKACVLSSPARTASAILAVSASFLLWAPVPAAWSLTPQPQSNPTQSSAVPAPPGSAAPKAKAKQAAASKAVHHRRHKAKEPVAPPEPVVAPLPAHPAPKFPAFDHAAEASVVWDSQGLSIDATNSSLEQIMSEVSMDTGVKVDGLNSDQRVFGKFGPGKASDVLSQLLQGSGYNVIMVGDQGQGTPREVLLSQRQNMAQQPAPRNNGAEGGADDDDQQPEEPPQPDNPQFHPNFQPGGPPRSPQQIMQDMQQRQQQQQDQPQPQPQSPN